MNLRITTDQVKNGLLGKIVGSGGVVKVDSVAVDKLEVARDVQLLADVLEVGFQGVVSVQADSELMWNHTRINSAETVNYCP